jgi:methanogenic corrinoid protein MtbC1/DNA-binding XRE family transcriptional regulator
MAGKRSIVDTGPSRQRYLRALVDGNSNAATIVVHELIGKRVSVADIYLDVLAPALFQIGDLWCDGKVNVAQEHLATQITLGQMDKLRLIQSVPRSLSYRVMVCCVEGEHHFIAARMATDLFQMEGWQVDFLGPDVPTAALIEIVSARRPNLLALSTTLQSNLRRTRPLIKRIRKLPAAPYIIVGGQAALGDNSGKNKIQGIETATNVIEGVRLAKKMLVPDRPKAILSDYLKELGRRVRDLRQQAGWTQEQLAKATRLTRAYIVAVEGGKQNVSIDVVIRVANGLGVPPDQLLAMEELPVTALNKIPD